MRFRGGWILTLVKIIIRIFIAVDGVGNLFKASDDYGDGGEVNLKKESAKPGQKH